MSQAPQIKPEIASSSQPGGEKSACKGLADEGSDGGARAGVSRPRRARAAQRGPPQQERGLWDGARGRDGTRGLRAPLRRPQALRRGDEGEGQFLRCSVGLGGWRHTVGQAEGKVGVGFLFFLFPLTYMKQGNKKKPSLAKAQNPADFTGALGLHPCSGKLQSKKTGQITIFIQQVTSRDCLICSCRLTTMACAETR